MSKTYRPWNPDQGWLLPPSPRDWLEEGDLVYFLLDTVNELDISSITAKYEQEGRGYGRCGSRGVAIGKGLQATAVGFLVPAGFSRPVRSG